MSDWRRRWHGRVRTAEALAAIVAATLVAWAVPPRHWNRFKPAGGSAATLADIAPRAAAIRRAERRLGREARCLPRALALILMLRRRSLVADLVIGGPQQAGSPVDLHAWIELDGTRVFGERDVPDRAMFRF